MNTKVFSEYLDYIIKDNGYSLLNDHVFDTSFRGYEYESQLFSINKDGLIIGKENYWWDGASGPAIDTHNAMRGSCLHDILYALIRIGVIPNTYFNRRRADLILYKALRKDGMSWFRASYWFMGVRLGGWSAI